MTVRAIMANRIYTPVGGSPAGGGSPEPDPWTIEQSACNGTTGITNTISVGSGEGWSTPTSGNLIIVFFVCRTDDFNPTTPTGFTQHDFLQTGGTGDQCGWIYSKVSDGTESTITVSKATGDNRYLSLHCHEISWSGSVGTYQDSNIIQTGTVSSIDVTLASTTSGSLMLGYAELRSVNYSSWDSPFTHLCNTTSTDESSSAYSTGTGSAMTATCNFDSSNGANIAIIVEFNN